MASAVAKGLLLKELRCIRTQVWANRHQAVVRLELLIESLDAHRPELEPAIQLPLLDRVTPDYVIPMDECPLRCSVSVRTCIARQKVMDLETKRNPDRPWELRRHDGKRGAKQGRFPLCATDRCWVGRKYRRILGDDLARGVKDGARSDLAEQAKARARYEASHPAVTTMDNDPAERAD